MSEPEAVQPRIALLGVPIEIGASQLGTLMGPDALRTAGIGRILDQLGFAVEDYGNMAKPGVAPAEGPPPANAKYYDTIKGWIRTLSERSYSLASSGAVPIFMGGDHSLSMGSVNGVARYWQEQGRPLFVLWLDAHADYNTPQTTETGNMHGMSRGASDHGAAARFGSGALSRHRRAQSVSRRTRPHRARRGRAGQQPVRTADHRSPDAKQCGPSW